MNIIGYQMTAKDAPFEKVEIPIAAIKADEALIEIAGCGVCHTDVSFWHHGVPTRHEMPLILGHEITGIVLEGPPYLKGEPVIVPAVLPCGECTLCKRDRSNICQSQKMPGNDFHGGFASHVTVPGKFLSQLPDDIGEFGLSQLSVIADAITTPYQSLIRSGLRAGDLAIVIGVGGVGLYMVQLALGLCACHRDILPLFAPDGLPLSRRSDLRLPFFPHLSQLGQ